MGIRTRLITAVMAVAVTLTVVGGVATASASPIDSVTGVAQAEKTSNELPSGGGKPEPGTDKPGVPEEAVTLLAAELHISVDRARQVFHDLKKVKARGEAILEDPAFVAIANGLGITPQQLLTTLRKVKQAIGEKPKDKVPGSSEAK